MSETFLILRRTERDIIKKLYIGLHVKYRYYCQILMEHEFSLQIFEKNSNIKFHENPSNRSGVAPCGQKERQTCMTKLTAAFRNFAKAPKGEDIS